jgi:hypothetical protein
LSNSSLRANGQRQTPRSPDVMSQRLSGPK